MRHIAPLAALLVGGPLLAPAALAADVEKWEPDETIRNGLAVHVTQNGFDQLGEVAKELVPTLLPPDLIAIPDLDLFVVSLSGANVGISFDKKGPNDNWPKVDIVPINSRPGAKLEARIQAYINIGSQADPYQASCLLDDGDGSITAKVTLKLPVEVAVVTVQGVPQLDLNVDTNALGITLSDVQARGACSTLFGGVITSLGNTLISALKPQFAPMINDALAGLGDALKAATISQELDVLGKTLFVDLEPLQVNSYANNPAATGKNGGLELIYSTKFTAAQDPCVADIDPLGSLKTDNPIPGIADTAPAQIGAYVADDMLNQALYAVFSGGLLCLDVDESLLGDTSLPIPIDSSLISLIGGEGFSDILPEDPAPLLIRTHPYEVPTARFGDPNPIQIDLNRLGVDFVTDMEYRQAVVIGIAVSADVGVDLDFDDQTGLLSVALEGLDAEAFEVEATGDEFVAGSNARLPESLQGLLGQLLPLVLGSVTDSLAFNLPSFALAEGSDPLGLTSLSLGVAGSAGDWLIAEAGLGTVAYTPPADGGGGCGGCGGDTGGCGGGCSSNGGLGGFVGFGVFLPMWVLRRRRG